MSLNEERYGIHQYVMAENRPMRLMQAELEAHPEWHGFRSQGG